MGLNESHDLAVAAAQRGDFEQGAAIARAAGLEDTALTIEALRPQPAAVVDDDVYTADEFRTLTRDQLLADPEKARRTQFSAGLAKRKAV